MSTTLTVAEAETTLAAARADAAKLEREQALAKIQELRRVGAELMQQLRPMVAQINQAQADRLRLHGELMNARNQIAIYSQPLDPLTFPTDADIAAHAEQLRLWRKHQKELLAQSEDACLRESIRLRAVALQTELNHLQQMIRNLIPIAEGRRVGDMEGGLYQGVEDFIGNLQTAHL
jgi:hypothetical protein